MGKPSARLELIPSMVTGWKDEYSYSLAVGRVNASGAGWSGSCVGEAWLVEAGSGRGDLVSQTWERLSFSVPFSLSLGGGAGGMREVVSDASSGSGPNSSAREVCLEEMGGA